MLTPLRNSGKRSGCKRCFRKKPRETCSSVRIVVAGDEIVAEIELERKPRWIERHVGELRFAVIPGNEVLASEAVEEVLRESKTAGIEVVIYFHLRTQESGLNLARQLEFKDAGVIEQYYRRDGRTIDRIYLSKIL